MKVCRQEIFEPSSICVQLLCQFAYKMFSLASKILSGIDEDS